MFETCSQFGSESVKDYFELIFCLQGIVKRNNDFRGVRAGGNGAASGKGQVSHRGQKKIQ